MIVPTKSILSSILLLTQLLGVLPLFASGQSVRSQTRRRPAPRTGSSADMTKGLQIRLSEGAESGARPQPLNVAPAASLTDAEAQNVLKRLEPIKIASEDE